MTYTFPNGENDPKGNIMSVKFAEQVLEGMVDENGHCGERGMSAKQFEILRPYLEETKARYCGGWTGSNGGGIQFSEWDAEGTIGKFNVKLHLVHHFNLRVEVVSIDQWIDEVPTFEGSEWQAEPKKRIDLELTLVRVNSFERPAYTYGTETVRIFTLADDEGNCYVWKTTGYLETYGEDDRYTFAKPGDKVTMRATVKEHGEWNGIKQTVLTRCKVSEIAER